MSRLPDDPVIPCVGAIVLDERRRLLVVRRGQEPGRGLWSVPGGRVEPGESDAVALVREVAEETGLRVAVVRHVGTVRRRAPDGGTYEIRDFLARPVGVPAPEPRAGDDAAAARWVTRAELDALPVVAGLVTALGEWRLLPE